MSVIVLVIVLVLAALMLVMMLMTAALMLVMMVMFVYHIAYFLISAAKVHERACNRVAFWTLPKKVWGLQ